jgi:hypothetical protein
MKEKNIPITVQNASIVVGRPVRTGVINEKTYICLYEYPDGSLVIEGLRDDPLEVGFLSQRIRFTQPAIEALNEALTEWLKTKKED